MAPHTDTRYHLPNMPPLSQPTDSTPNRLDFRPLSDVMAAEVIGLDLSRPLDAATRDDLFESFLCHQLLVFRDQKLTKDQQVTFTEQFGTLERHTLRNRGSSSVASRQQWSTPALRRTTLGLQRCVCWCI